MNINSKEGEKRTSPVEFPIYQQSLFTVTKPFISSVLQVKKNSAEKKFFTEMSKPYSYCQNNENRQQRKIVPTHE